jgi:hypothetical protein
MRPTEEQYRGMKTALRERKKEFVAAVAAKNKTAQRDAGIGVVRAIYLCLLNDSEILDEGLLTPLGAVESAVFDAGRGAKVALFKPEPRSEKPASTKPTGTTRENTQGMFAFALELLKTGGKMGIDLAAKWIVAEASKLRIVDEAGYPIDAKRIITWRKDICRGKAPDEARETFDGLRRLPKHAVLLGRAPIPKKREACKALVIGILKSSRDLAPQTAPRRTAPRDAG